MRSGGTSSLTATVTYLFVIGGCAPPVPSVPVEQEPRHRLVSDETFAQVLDVLILGNDTTLYHTHSRPIAYVCLGGSGVSAQVLGEDWGDPSTPCRPGDVFGNPEYPESPLTHRVANPGPDAFHLLAIQNLGETPSSEPGTTVGTTVLDNDWFRAQEIEIDPRGAADPYSRATPRHTHAAPTLLVLIEDGIVASVDERGREHIVVEPGAWVWLEAGESHSLVSTLGIPTRVIEIEVR